MQAAEGAFASGKPCETDTLRSEAELSEMRPVLECVNQVGASTTESLVCRYNYRFHAMVDISKQRSKNIKKEVERHS